MRKKIYAVFFMLFASIGWATAQSGLGNLEGTVSEKGKPKETLFGVNVAVYQNGVLKGGGSTDSDGRYRISALPPGTYEIRVSYTGYQSKTITGVLVQSDRIVRLNVELSEGVELKEVEITEYSIPLISVDNTSSGKTVSKEEIEKLATRDVNSIAALASGTFQADEGSAINVRGARSNGTEYFIDGVRVRGSLNLPNEAIEQTTVITGGVPAQYGDLTGGVISITTRGPSSKLRIGGEVLSSAFLEPYGYNLGALNVTGPIYKKAKGTKEERTVLGYFISGEIESQRDPNPYALMGGWNPNADFIAGLRQNPLFVNPNTGGITQVAQFATRDNFFSSRARSMAANNRATGNGKIDFSPSKNINIALGFTFDRTWGDVFSNRNMLFNADNNGIFQNTTYRGFLRFSQKFGGNPGDSTSSIIKNARYSVQVEYTKSMGRQESRNLGRNHFLYNYYGNYDVTQQDIFIPFANPLRPLEDSLQAELLNLGYTALFFAGRQDLGVRFTGANYNPVLTNYMNNIYDLVNNSSLTSLQSIEQFQGFLNGQRPGLVNGIWNPVGQEFGGFNYFDNNILRLQANGAAEIKGHTLTFGFEFDQRTDRGYSFNPNATAVGLWGLGRDLTNRHLRELDLNNPVIIFDDIQGTARVSYNPLVANNQSQFDSRLRAALGYGALDIINIDNIDPRLMRFDWFSANELINQNNNAFVSYFGYDHLGNKLKRRPGNFEFFNDTINRPIGAFSPTYLAGYIEDKFSYNDLIFRIGVRVDRFDANQPALRDPFLLFPAFTKSEVDGSLNVNGAHPSVAQDDWVVYVDNNKAPNPRIIGYRSGDRWFNASGDELRNANQLSTVSGRPEPLLKNRDQVTADAESFRDYKPQVNVMPRVAFSFPISDDALFFAHYDVLTQRPPSNLRFDPVTFAFLPLWGDRGSAINNPDLRPEQTIDYQLGFQQRLTNSSALKISAFYREMRGMIQQVQIFDAFPLAYRTFGNIDFGTVKGLSFDYDLRRTGNITLSGSYTIQFADGTGSTANFASTLSQAGIPTIRSLQSLDFDARHRFVANLDFRYDKGEKYNGPVVAGVKILEDFGFNLVGNFISGTPFSRQTFVTPAAAPGISGRSNLQGTINGSRLPWQTRINLRIDKNFDVKIGKDKEGNAKFANMLVYIQVLNLLNNQNVLSVYQFTGSPTDDGYLTSGLGQQQLNNFAAFSQQAFIDQYVMSMEDPRNFSLPRRARIGVRFNF